MEPRRLSRMEEGRRRGRRKTFISKKLEDVVWFHTRPQIQISLQIHRT